MDDFGFDWDAGNWPKCGRHGLSQDEIEFVFRNKPLVAPDDKHAEVEDRFIAVGRSVDGRPVFVGFTYRGTAERPLVRPITARFMHRRRRSAMSRKVPKMKTDDEVEAFLEQDLSDLDFSQFKPWRFEFENKDARVNMRLPQRQLDRLKAEASKRGVPYQRLIRELLERGLHALEKS